MLRILAKASGQLDDVRTKLELIKVEGLPAIVETIRNLLSTPVGSVVLAIFVFSYLVIKVPQVPLIQSLIGRKASRLMWLKEHSISTSEEVYCKSVVEDIRDAMIFEKATGIYAEKNWRKGLVELHDQAGVSWTTMKRARKFMRIESDGTVFIRVFKLGDQIEAWFNAVMTWVFIAMATVVLITAPLFKPTVLSLLSAIPLCILLFGCAVGAAFQNAPKHAATTIRDKLSSNG